GRKSAWAVVHGVSGGVGGRARRGAAAFTMPEPVGRIDDNKRLRPTGRAGMVGGAGQTAPLARIMIGRRWTAAAAEIVRSLAQHPGAGMPSFLNRRPYSTPLARID